jgi:hypothetical protein
MGLGPNLQQPILKVLEAFFEYDNTTEKMRLISKLLDAQDDAPTKALQKITYYLSYNSFKILKAVQLLEFLTIFNPSKLAEIINTHKFMDSFSSAVMEEDVQTPILNLLRLWHDKYAKDMHQVNLIFDFIENLQVVDITLPASYKSKYEDESYKIEADTNNDQKDEREGEDDIVEILSPFGILIRGSVQKMFDDFCNNLTVSMNLNELRARIGADNTDYRRDQEKEFENKSKISQSLEDYSKKEMDIDEYVAYKTLPCPERMKCRFISKDKENFEPNSSPKKEVQHCPYWHNGEDRRRPFCDENGKMLYTFQMCKVKDDCWKGDKCKKCHNIVEKMYHPMGYKKKPCSLSPKGNSVLIDKKRYGTGPLRQTKRKRTATTSCKNEKFCSHYHSQEEKDFWALCLKEYLSLQDNSDNIANKEENEEKETDGTPQEIDIEKQVPPHMTIHHGRQGGIGKLINLRRNGKESSTERMEAENEKLLTKTTQSKLIIRKKYLQPSQLTSVLSANPCFLGIPFFGGGALESQGEENSLKEENDKKVINVDTINN